MANGHGGRRPGAGRKKQETVEQQTSRRGVVLDVIDDNEWRETVKAWLALSRETPSVIYPLLPYLLGSPKQEHEHTGPNGGPFRIVIETVSDRGRDGDS